MSYKNVLIPKGKPKKEYNAAERRAELMEAIITAGYPEAVHQTQAAELYGVKQPTIHRDIKEIKKYIVKNIGTDAELKIELTFLHAIKKLIQEGKPKEAAHVAKQWGDWLFDMGAKEKTPDKIESNVSGEVRMVDVLKAVNEATEEIKTVKEIGVSTKEAKKKYR